MQRRIIPAVQVIIIVNADDGNQNISRKAIIKNKLNNEHNNNAYYVTVEALTYASNTLQSIGKGAISLFLSLCVCVCVCVCVCGNRKVSAPKLTTRAKKDFQFFSQSCNNRKISGTKFWT